MIGDLPRKVLAGMPSAARRIRRHRFEKALEAQPGRSAHSSAMIWVLRASYSASVIRPFACRDLSLASLSSTDA